MNEPRLIFPVIGTATAWGFASITWTQIGTGFAVAASLATIWAAIETALWRRKQRKDGK